MDKSKKQLLDLVFCEKESTVKDKCVICGKETPYYKTTHIDFRRYYVEGCGQLCKNCYENGEDFELINPEKDETY